MHSLNESSRFMPHLDQIREYLWKLQQAQEWINGQNVDESRICECLCYLIDLCLVISKYDLNLSQIK